MKKIISGIKLKKIISGLIIVMVLLSVGCTKKVEVEHDYMYMGQNEDWTVSYKVEGKSTTKGNKDTTEYDSEKECIFTYKKDISELSSVKNLELSYKSSVASGSVVENYEGGKQPKKTYNIVPSNKAEEIEKENDIIDVTINIDGKIQKIQLKNQK